MEMTGEESIVRVHSAELAAEFWAEIHQAFASPAGEVHREFDKDSHEFNEFIERLKAGHAEAKVRKMFWYRQGSCHLAEEIWFADKANPRSAEIPLKSYVVVHVHYHGSHSSFLNANLSLVDAVNARHLAAVNQYAPKDYSTECPFFDTWMERSGPSTLKVFPASGLRNFCSALEWRQTSRLSTKNEKQVHLLLQHADFALSWTIGDEQLLRNVSQVPSSADCVLRIRELQEYCRKNLHKTLVPANTGQSDQVKTIVVDPEPEYPPHEFGKELPDTMPWQVTFLFVAANNEDKVHLALDEEMKLHKKHFGHEDARFRFVRKSRAETHKFPALLDKYEPTVLHFGCHGDSSCLEFFGAAVSKRSILTAIRIFQKKQLRCAPERRIRLAIVNACMSADLAQDLSECIDIVIGHWRQVKDKVALKFTEMFYGRLGKEGYSVKDCFDSASSMLQIEDRGEYRLFSPHVDPDQFFLFDPNPASKRRRLEGSAVLHDPAAHATSAHGTKDVHGSLDDCEQDEAECHDVYKPDKELFLLLKEKGLKKEAYKIAQFLGVSTREELERTPIDSILNTARRELPPRPFEDLKRLVHWLQEEAAISSASTDDVSDQEWFEGDGDVQSDRTVVMAGHTDNVTSYRQVMAEFIEQFEAEIVDGFDSERVALCSVLLFDALGRAALADSRLYEDCTAWFRDSCNCLGEDESFLTAFEDLAGQSEAFASAFRPEAQGSKKHSLCVAVISEAVQKYQIGSDWEGEVVRDWHENAESVLQFLQRAESFFRSNWCRFDDALKSITLMDTAVDTESFEAFLVMDRVGEMLLFAWLEWTRGSARDQGHHFKSFVSSKGRSWRRDGQSPGRKLSLLVVLLGSMSRLDLKHFLLPLTQQQDRAFGKTGARDLEELADDDCDRMAAADEKMPKGHTRSTFQQSRLRAKRARTPDGIPNSEGSKRLTTAVKPATTLNPSPSLPSDSPCSGVKSGDTAHSGAERSGFTAEELHVLREEGGDEELDEYDDEEVSEDSQDEEETFEASEFRKHYEKCREQVSSDFELLSALKKFLQCYYEHRNAPAEQAARFLTELRVEATEESPDWFMEGLSDVEGMAQRLWTSTPEGLNGKEFCSMLNDAIRSDDPVLMKHAVVFVRTINAGLINRRKLKGKFPWPPKNETYRGAILPVEHLEWYQNMKGRKYRVPGFLATSFSEDTAEEFASRAWSASSKPRHPAVRFEVKLDPAGRDRPVKRCKHVSLIRNSNVPDEGEFLYVPYSVFTVKEVRVSKKPDYKNPHVIVLDSALDNELEPEKLPLAPWY